MQLLIAPFRRMMPSRLLRGSSLIAVFLLAACGSFADWKQAITGDRPAQYVEGPRRPPEMNTQLPEGIKTAPAQPPAAPAPAAEATPYDRFNAATGEMQEAPVPAAAPQEKQGSLLGRLFGSAPAAEPERKKLPENPYYPSETVKTAPVPPGPQSALPEGAETEQQAHETAEAAPVLMESESSMTLDTEAAPVVESKAEPVPAASDEGGDSWFDRQWAALKGSYDPAPVYDLSGPETAGMNVPAAEENVPYPLLSSVPPRPDRMTLLKQESPQAMRDLEIDHALAMEQKQSLDAEPLDGETAPEQDAADASRTLPPVMVEPEPSAIEPSPAAEPVLLGHASSDFHGSTPVQPEAMEAIPAPLADETPQAAEPTETAAPAKGWWEKWNLTGDKDLTAPPAALPPAEEEAALPPPTQAEILEPEAEPMDDSRQQLETLWPEPQQEFAPVVTQEKPPEPAMTAPAPEATPAPEIAAPQEEEQQPAPAMAETPMPAAEQPAVAQEESAESEDQADAASSRQPYWWEGWNLFSGEKNAPPQREEAKEMPIEEAQPQAAPPAPAEPAPPAQAAEPLPQLMPAAAPAVAEVVPVAQPATESAQALPSPQILQRVKMMPPSRYEGRARARRSSSSAH